jgi:hypothetical protein
VVEIKGISLKLLSAMPWEGRSTETIKDGSSEFVLTLKSKGVEALWCGTQRKRRGFFGVPPLVGPCHFGTVQKTSATRIYELSSIKKSAMKTRLFFLLFTVLSAGCGASPADAGGAHSPAQVAEPPKKVLNEDEMRVSLREETREMFMQFCGSCHTGKTPDENADARQIFDLNEKEWASHMTDQQLTDSYSLIKGKSLASPEALKQITTFFESEKKKRLQTNNNNAEVIRLACLLNLKVCAESNHTFEKDQFGFSQSIQLLLSSISPGSDDRQGLLSTAGSVLDVPANLGGLPNEAPRIEQFYHESFPKRPALDRVRVGIVEPESWKLG